MADHNITTGANLFQGGRASAPDSSIGASFLRFAGILVGLDNYIFQFPTGTSGQQSFGTPLSVFIDNAVNAFAVDITVVTTGQTFPVPANTTGFYLIDAVAGSSIIANSEGNSVGAVEFIFYNYARTPYIWYKFGATTAAITVANGADVALGNTADAAVINPALAATVIALSKGLLTEAVATLAKLNSGVTVTPSGENYETVAASQANQILGGAGAAGDMLDTVTIYPATTSPGSVIVKDGATVIATFPGGAASVSNLVPFILPFGNARAVTNWNISTGANVSVVANGAKFT